MNKLTWTLLAVFLIIIVASVVCVVFETPFAEASIDWLSFFAGAFLASEGIYKILQYRKDPSYVQICRALRIFIGVNVFIVHLAEFIWGPQAPAEASALLGTIIDWSAFSFGIFLMIEGSMRISFSSEPSPSDQTMRVMRAVIGSSVFTIHILQFMRN